MTKLKYLLLLIAYFFVSCEKEEDINSCLGECITIKGRITTEQGSKVAVDHAVLKLSWSKPDFNPLGFPQRDIATTKSDKNGYYEFEFTPEPGDLEGGFQIDVSKTGFIPGYMHNSNIKTNDTIVTMNYHLPKITHIEVIINNFHPILQEDFFHVMPSYNNYRGGLYGCRCFDSDSLEDFVNSEAIDSITEYTCETAGNQYTIIKIVKKKNGVKEFITDSIYTEVNTITTYEIEY